MGVPAAATVAKMMTFSNEGESMVDPEHVAVATEALDSVHDMWMARSDVISVEVARRWIDGVPTDEVGIRVTVEALPVPDEGPEGNGFPDEVKGVPVDVVEGTRPVLER